MNATMQATRFWIEIIAALTIALAIGAVMYQRFQQNSSPVSIRTIQLLAIAVLAPSAVGALIGALLGYLLSGIGNERS